MCPKQITLTPDLDPVDGRRIARNLRTILDSLPEEVQGLSVSFVDSSELDATSSLGEAFAEIIEDLDTLQMTNRQFDNATAIVRSRPAPTSPSGERWDVRSVVWDWDYAESEVARLNELSSDTGTRYFAQGTRVERRTRESQHIFQPLGTAKWPGDPDGPLVHTFTSVIEFNPETVRYEGRIPTYPDIKIDAHTAEDCINTLKATLRRRIDDHLENGTTIPQDRADIRLVPVEVNAQGSTVR